MLRRAIDAGLRFPPLAWLRLYGATVLAIALAAAWLAAGVVIARLM
jgi:hypothetical protein